MSDLSDSAKLVKEALARRGLETPMTPNDMGREEKKEKLSITCVKYSIFSDWI